MQRMSGQAFKPVYVLAGEDALLRDQHRRQVVQQVIGQADPQLCVRTLDGSSERAEVLDELRTPAFLAPAKVVILREADDFVTKHREALLKYLESPSPTAALVLMVDSWRPSKLSKLVDRIGEVMSCRVADEEDLSAWLAKEARKRGKTIDPEAAELLAQWVGRDFSRLDAELEKLCLFIAQRQKITVEDVGQVVADVAGPAAYELANALTAADLPAALRALRRMLVTSNEAYVTLGAIAWHLRRVLGPRQQVASGVPAAQAVPHNLPFPQKQAMGRLLQRRSLERMQADLRATLAADLAIKSGGDPAAVLEGLVVTLCS